MEGKTNDGKEKGTACDRKIKYIYEKKQGKNSEWAEFNFKWKLKWLWERNLISLSKWYKFVIWPQLSPEGFA